MIDKVKVTILVVVHNAADIVGKCIQTLINQTLKELEIIVIDNASVDNTIEIVSSYIGQKNYIRVEKETTYSSIVNIWNKFLPQLQSEYVLFFNCRDNISLNYLESLYNCVVTESGDCEVVLNDMLSENLSLFLRDSKRTGLECLAQIQGDDWKLPVIYGNLYKTELVKKICVSFTDDYTLDKCFIPCLLSQIKYIVKYKSLYGAYYQHLSFIESQKNILVKGEAEVLSSTGDKVLKYAENEVQRNERGIRELLYLYAKHLYQQSQNIYEKALYSSSKKCVYIITEDGIGGKYGVGTYVHQLKQCFDLHEWDVNIVTLYKAYDEQRFKIYNGIAYYEFKNLLRNYSNDNNDGKVIYLKSVFYYLASRINNDKKLYCHFNFATHGLLAHFFKELLHARIFFTLHFTDWSFELLGNMQSLKRLISNPIGESELRIKEKFMEEKRFMQKDCDNIIAIAKHSYEMLHELYEIPYLKIFYIPNGLEDSCKLYDKKERNFLKQKYGFSKNEKIILFVGRLDAIKGIIQLIEAFKYIVSKLPFARLVIVGTGNFQQCLNMAYPINKHVIFTGFLTKSQLSEFYAIANIGVVPSIYEEFGYVAAEMMMHALPVLVNNTTGLKELVAGGKYGEIFEYGENENISDLSQKIIQALRKKKYPDVKARKRVQQKYLQNIFLEKVQLSYLDKSTFI